MRALGAKASAVWPLLSPAEAEQVSAAMHALPDQDHGAEQQAVQSYVRTMQTPRSQTGAADGSVWERLSERDGGQIAHFIQDESPQVIAVIVSKLGPGAAAQTVRALPRALATEALKRLLKLGDVHPAAIRALEASLETRLAHVQADGFAGGHEHVARIFDRLDSRSEHTLLTALESAEPGAGKKIRTLMFTFDDLAALDPASLQTILSSTDRSLLIVALKGANAPVADAFFTNMTQRAGDLLREEIEALGPVRRGDIDLARSEILTVARALVRRGDILSAQDDDELVE
ncbi:MAG: FliG C-terminal domain-containing protein [Pseudomonadota bacterium]